VAKLSDETLMAYADGELPTVERARVATILAGDAASRARLAMFTATGKSLAEQFTTPMDEPVPQHLLDLVLGGKPPADTLPAAVATPRMPSVRREPGFAARLMQFFTASQPRWQLALGCSTALLIGLGSGWALHRAPVGQGQAQALASLADGRLLAQGALLRVLESAPTGQQVALDSRQSIATIQARLTFRSRQQEFCRHYELAVRDGGHFAGIGCRGSDGRWQVQLHTQIAASRMPKGQTVPAGNDASTDLAALLDRMIDGDALGGPEEAALIAKQWRP
jgi:anti-sigma factor RsiW